MRNVLLTTVLGLAALAVLSLTPGESQAWSPTNIPLTRIPYTNIPYSNIPYSNVNVSPSAFPGYSNYYFTPGYTSSYYYTTPSYYYTTPSYYYTTPSYTYYPTPSYTYTPTYYYTAPSYTYSTTPGYTYAPAYYYTPSYRAYVARAFVPWDVPSYVPVPTTYRPTYLEPEYGYYYSPVSGLYQYYPAARSIYESRGAVIYR